MLYKKGGAHKSTQDCWYDDLVDTKPAKKVIEKSVKFPMSESYVEKLLVVHFKGVPKPIELYFNNYTELYKKCYNLGITNKSYFRFMAVLTDICSISRKSQLETITFKNVELQTASVKMHENLPKGVANSSR